VEKTRGAVNSPVKLTIVRGPEKEVKEFTIVRDLIRVHSNYRMAESVRAPKGNLPGGIALVRTANCWRLATSSARRSMFSMERPSSGWANKP
jgi:hypothetical protein